MLGSGLIIYHLASLKSIASLPFVIFAAPLAFDNTNLVIYKIVIETCSVKLFLLLLVCGQLIIAHLA